MKPATAIGGGIAACALCALGVWALRSDAPPAYDEAGHARLPIVMPRADAEAYLRRLGYPHLRNTGALLIGADLHCATDAECRKRRPKIVFDYSDGDPRPRCITVTHAYDLDYASILGKLAGTDPGDLPDPGKDARREVRSSAGSVTVVLPRPNHLAVGPGC